MSEKKIKIIYIITALGFGGAERMLLDLVRFLNKERYEIKVATVVGSGPLVEDFRTAGIEVTIFKKKSKLGSGVIWQLYKYLKKEKPMIVHTHLFGGDTWGRLAAILARVPVLVSTEHNTNLDEGWTKRKIKKFLSWFTKRIVAVSEAVQQYSVARDHIKKKKIVVIPNGIEIEKYLTIPEKNFNHPPIISIVGRLEKQKGHEYLFEALNLIKNIPWVLWVVGNGSLKMHLERLARDLSLRERIIFLGGRHNVSEILAKTDIFVLPSLWEGLGIAVLEAAAAGKPIVASMVGGIPEIIEHEKTGLLIESRNVKSLAEGLERMLLGEEEAREMGRRAREVVAQKFDVRKMVEKYERLYEELMSK